MHNMNTDTDGKKLDKSVKNSCDRCPNCGYRLLYGLIYSHGTKVLEKRIRESTHCVDPQKNLFLIQAV